MTGSSVDFFFPLSHFSSHNKKNNQNKIMCSMTLFLLVTATAPYQSAWFCWCNKCSSNCCIANKVLICCTCSTCVGGWGTHQQHGIGGQQQPLHAGGAAGSRHHVCSPWGNIKSYIFLLITELYMMLNCCDIHHEVLASLALYVLINRLGLLVLLYLPGEFWLPQAITFMLIQQNLARFLKNQSWVNKNAIKFW